MSGIGFWELIILALLGLIVLGPERLPRVASQIGGWLGQARRMTRVMRRQLEDELNFEKEFSTKKDDKPKADETTPAKSTPDVSTPKFVQDNAVEHDDHYSPAHDTDSVGLGVNDEPEPDPDNAEAEAVELAAAEARSSDEPDPDNAEAEAVELAAAASRSSDEAEAPDDADSEKTPPA